MSKRAAANDDSNPKVINKEALEKLLPALREIPDWFGGAKYYPLTSSYIIWVSNKAYHLLKAQGIQHVMILGSLADINELCLGRDKKLNGRDPQLSRTTKLQNQKGQIIDRRTQFLVHLKSMEEQTGNSTSLGIISWNLGPI